MKQTYTIPQCERERILKKLESIAKKANQYGGSLSYDTSEPYAKEIKIYNREEPETYDTVTYEVFDLTIDGDIIRKGEYRVLASIEHTENGNIVKGTETSPEWWNIAPRCEHCNTKHSRRLTYMVKRTDGITRQIGRTCLKDYCGIDPHAIGIWNEITDLMEAVEPEQYDWEEREVKPVTDVLTALALAIGIERAKGYTRSDEKNSNREMLTDLTASRTIPTAEDMEKAKTMAAAIDSMDTDTADKFLLANMKTLLKGKYCRMSNLGFIAYAPVAFRKWTEYQHRMEEKRESAYLGEVGSKVQETVRDMRCITSWDGDYGRTYVYEITSMDGNIMIWKTGKALEGTITTITGKVKEHTEYKGIKQTVLTRCKVA